MNEMIDKSVITILCPVYNESDNVDRFVREFMCAINLVDKRYSFEFLFADNCSTDDTVKRLLRLQSLHSNIRIIKYSRNFGVMKSIFTGILNSNTNACAVFDCDLQDPPELIVDFVNQWEAGAKVVYGVRRKRDEGSLIAILRNVFRNIETFFKGYKVNLESGAWFLDARVIQELRKVPFEPYLAGLIARLGFKSIGVPYDRRKRLYGESKFGFVKYFSYARDGLVSGTIAPLRLAVLFGIIFSLLSFLFGLYFIYAKLFLNINFAAGMAGLIVIVLFGFGLSFFLIGIVGEYVGRIYLEKESSQFAIIEESFPCIEFQNHKKTNS